MDFKARSCSLLVVLTFALGCGPGEQPAVTEQTSHATNERVQAETSPTLTPGQITGNIFAVEDNPEPKRKHSSANSLPGTIRRGLSPQYYIKQSAYYALPKDFPTGRFFFYRDNEETIFSCDSPRADSSFANRRKAGWQFFSVLSEGRRKLELGTPLPHIKSYSQCRDRMSSFIAPTIHSVELVTWLTRGSSNDWFSFGHHPGNSTLGLDSNAAVIMKDFPHRSCIAWHDEEERSRERIAVVNLEPISENENQRAKTQRYRIYQGGQLIQDAVWKYSDTEELIQDDPKNEKGYRRMFCELPLELAYSRNGDYLARLHANGVIQVSSGRHFFDIYKFFDVLGEAPYYSERAPDELERAKPFRNTRISWSKRSDHFVIAAGGKIQVFDATTKERYVLRMPVRIDAACYHKDGNYIMAASTESGEVYVLHADTAAKGETELFAKALLSGLGPMTAYVNFSQDGTGLSGIFDESFIYGPYAIAPEARFAMFWDVEPIYVKNPPSYIPENEMSFTIRPEFRSRYEGFRAAFAGFGRKAKNDKSIPVWDLQRKTARLLMVFGVDRETREMKFLPFAVLTEESQLQAVSFSSLVEPSDDSENRLYDPHKRLSYVRP